MAKKNQVTIGSVWTVKVSGNVVPVKIVSESPYGGWNGINVHTKREVRIKSAARLRLQMPINQAEAEKSATVVLPDGYTGHTARFHINPLRVDGDLVLLQCADHGKQYMQRWATRDEVRKAQA